MEVEASPQKYIDTHFATNLDENITSLLHTMFAISGKHGINPNKATRWVSAQKTPLKREVARHLIDHTVYVTFREYFNGIGKLIKTHYETIVRDAQHVILYVSFPTKSYYISAIIAMHFIRKYKFREPDSFVHTLYNSTTQDPILIIDDMAYSGSQMSNWLTNIYKQSIPNYFKNKYNFIERDTIVSLPKPNIHILLYGVNSYSQKKMSQITNVNTMMQKHVTIKGQLITVSHRTVIDIPSPFHVYFVKKFPLLTEVDPEKALLVNYFFSPYSYGFPLLSVYFDHKIADDNSTYMKILSYGPIIPASYSIRSLHQNHTEFKNIFEPIIDEDVSKQMGSRVLDKTIAQIEPILLKYEKDDPIASDTTLEFAPFLNNCSIRPTFIRQLEGMSYNEFLFPEEILMQIYNNVDIKPEKNMLDIIHRSKIIHDDQYKCIKPFYKLDTYEAYTSLVPTPASSLISLRSLSDFGYNLRVKPPRSTKMTKSKKMSKSKKTQRRHSMGGKK
jgi:hypothetical protein